MNANLKQKRLTPWHMQGGGDPQTIADRRAQRFIEQSFKVPLEHITKNFFHRVWLIKAVCD